MHACTINTDYIRCNFTETVYSKHALQFPYFVKSLRQLLSLIRCLFMKIRMHLACKSCTSCPKFILKLWLQNTSVIAQITLQKYLKFTWKLPQNCFRNTSKLLQICYKITLKLLPALRENYVMNHSKIIQELLLTVFLYCVKTHLELLKSYLIFLWKLLRKYNEFSVEKSWLLLRMLKLLLAILWKINFYNKSCLRSEFKLTF
jgi:hypothetical protein